MHTSDCFRSHFYLTKDYMSLDSLLKLLNRPDFVGITAATEKAGKYTIF
jgi:hypothetical protein